MKKKNLIVCGCDVLFLGQHFVLLNSFYCSPQQSKGKESWCYAIPTIVSTVLIWFIFNKGTDEQISIKQV